MDIKKHKFQTVTGLDIVFPTIRTDKALLEEAKKRGFYGGNSKYNTLFSTLFFSGGKLNIKKDLDEEFKAVALPYLKAFICSWESKHEEKEAICALLLSELVDA